MAKTKKTASRVIHPNRSKLLASYFESLDTADGSPGDLVVGEGETLLLSYSSSGSRFKHAYREIRPGSVDELKDLIGVPDTAFNMSYYVRTLKAHMCGPRAGTAGIGKTNFGARVISPSVLMCDDGEHNSKEVSEALEVAREATINYVYGNSEEIALNKPLIEKFLGTKDIVIWVPGFDNITVHDNGTLNIAADTYVVHANRITLYGDGKIVCDGPTTFDCQRFRGNVSTGGVIGQGATDLAPRPGVLDEF